MAKSTVTCVDCGKEREIRGGLKKPMRCADCWRKNVATKSTFNGQRKR